MSHLEPPLLLLLQLLPPANVAAAAVATAVTAVADIVVASAVGSVQFESFVVSRLFVVFWMMSCQWQ
jgi:hypothetical protein